MLSPKHVELIKSSLPALREAAIPITQAMYRRMFAANPEVARMFNPSHMHPEGQQGALAGSIVAYAEHLEDLDALGDALAVIVHKHVAVQVKPEQYAIVGGHLLAAITEVLGDAATPELMDAWTAAYGVLAKVCIEAEGAVYEAQRSAEGGWEGLREFEVVERKAETPTITSLWLSPVDDRGPLPSFAPGQHVSVALPGAEELALRQYSLVQAPGGDRWRVVVKAEPGQGSHAPGVVSNRLSHELETGARVKLTMPCGSFTLDPAAGDRPVVLLAGGVGITPLYSMAAALVAAKPERELLVVHAARDRASRPLDAELRALAENMTLVRIHEQPGADEQAGRDYDREGRLERAILEERLAALGGPGAVECWTCGPHAFMIAVDEALEALGVASERRHYEFFGPARPLPHALP